MYYYESVAHSPKDVERRTAIESSATKLKNVIAHIEAELEGKQGHSWVKGSAETTSSDRDHNRATQKRLFELILNEGVSTDEGHISTFSMARWPICG